MPTLPLSPDELLTTTRAVRKRLDLERPVPRELLLECLAIAQQAPTASNRQHWRFVVVTDAEKRAALAALYRRSWEAYAGRPGAAGNEAPDDPRRAGQLRVRDSAAYLAERLHKVPVHLIPCILGRTDGLPARAQASALGSIIPATWSFMLAARTRGLGTAWTTLHLAHEEEAARVLGIPYAEVMQVALIPVAFAKGDQFRPAPRGPLDEIVHWDTWGA